MELTKKAEALRQDLSLSKLLDVVIEIAKEVDNFKISKVKVTYPEEGNLITSVIKKKKK